MYSDFKNLNALGAQLANTATAVYTATAGKRCQIQGINLYNTNTTPEAVVLYVGGTSAAYTVFSYTLQAGETLRVPGLHVLEGAQVLYGTTTTGSKVNISVIGREET